MQQQLETNTVSMDMCFLCMCTHVSLGSTYRGAHSINDCLMKLYNEFLQPQHPYQTTKSKFQPLPWAQSPVLQVRLFFSAALAFVITNNARANIFLLFLKQFAYARKIPCTFFMSLHPFSQLTFPRVCTLISTPTHDTRRPPPPHCQPPAH